MNINRPWHKSGVSGAARFAMTLAEYLAQPQKLPQDDSPALLLVRVTQAIYLDFFFRSAGGFPQWVPVSEDEIASQTLWQTCPPESLALGPRVSALLETLQSAFLQPDQSCVVVPPSPHNGEMFLYHALYLQIQHDVRTRRWVSALRKQSPFTRLLTFPVMTHHPKIRWSDGQEGYPSLSVEETLHLLQHPALLFFLPHLAEQWADIPTPDPQKDWDAQIDRIHARHATLHLFLTECVGCEKFSLLSVFPLFFLRLLQQKVEQKILSVQQHKQWKLSHREQMIAAYTGLLSLHVLFYDTYQQHVVAPGAYGWNRPAEVRTFLQSHGKYWLTRHLHQHLSQLCNTVRHHTG